MYRFMYRKCQEKNEQRVEKWSTIFSRCIESRFTIDHFAVAKETNRVCSPVLKVRVAPQIAPMLLHCDRPSTHRVKALGPFELALIGTARARRAQQQPHRQERRNTDKHWRSSESSAFDNIQGEPRQARLLVARLHIEPRQVHRANHLIERHLVRLRLVQRDA
jgi:hypothetical protein